MLNKINVSSIIVLSMFAFHSFAEDASVPSKVERINTDAAPKKQAVKAKPKAKSAKVKPAKPSAKPAATPSAPATDAAAAGSPAPLASPAVPEASPVPSAAPSMSPVPTPEPAAAVATPAPVEAPAAKAEAAPAPESKQASTDHDLYGKKHRPLGDFLVGPYVTALAFPRPFSGGLEMKYWDLLGLSAGYGMFPQVTVSTVKVKITGWDARLKIYPFRGSFFLGVAYGNQTFTGSVTQSYSGVEATATVVQENKFIAPHIGWNWIWDCGFYMGLDLGVQLSSSRKTTPSSDANAIVQATAEYQKALKDVNDNADKIGKTPLPLLTLIKLGYFF